MAGVEQTIARCSCPKLVLRHQDGSVTSDEAQRVLIIAIQVDSSKQVKSAVLMSDAMYDQSGFTPAPMVKDHEVPAASVQLLKDLPGR